MAEESRRKKWYKATEWFFRQPEPDSDDDYKGGGRERQYGKSWHLPTYFPCGERQSCSKFFLMKRNQDPDHSLHQDLHPAPVTPFLPNKGSKVTGRQGFHKGWGLGR